MTDSAALPEWADADWYWQGWHAGQNDKAKPLITADELKRLIGEQDSYSLGYRDGLRAK